jgi:predicted metal-dependent HD superfamily phosphohydrolase
MVSPERRNEALRQRLLASYREPQRRYHTLQHLAECIARFEPVQDLATSPGEVELALWFHDAVYDVRRHDNEARSAAWARDELLAAPAAAAAAARVHALVMSTRHDALPEPGDAMLLVDIDLSILGASPDRFDEYEAQIRAEYAWVEDRVFRSKRRSILTAFLARPTIFGTVPCNGFASTSVSPLGSSRVCRTHTCRPVPAGAEASPAPFDARSVEPRHTSAT